MGDVVIRVERLSKSYRLGQRESYYALRDVLANAVKSPFRFFPRLAFRTPPSASNHIWALKEVSLEVKAGEVVGVIGRNGAGKTTLLKILSRITKPTAGQVAFRGRVGSLLEVGTGFHAELSGRENVYLNGAILGMRKVEIDRQFDEIVAFAEVEQFLDTPVKHYSSGMYVRLAFAVAAHLQAEILLIDEVLAVGDATFQKKCLTKMSTMKDEGRTILFISHNMDLISRLCEKAVLLTHGRVEKEGPATAIVEDYLAQQLTEGTTADLVRKSTTDKEPARFTRLQFVDARGNPRLTHVCGEDLIVRMQIVSQQNIADAALSVLLKTLSGTRIITSWTREVNFPVSLHKGLQTYQCHFHRVNFRPGHAMSVDLWMESQGVVLDFIEDARIIQVVEDDRTRHLSTDRYQGIVVCDYSWSCLTG